MNVRACGIIVEYNPFHNGHAYHAQKAREKAQADVVVAVMSGNFLQRGEPAIIDKWQRTQIALENGVDLVVELPVMWSVQAADYFAKGAVQILQALNCEALCFGTDVQSAFDYADFGSFVYENQARINTEYQQITDETISYSQKMNLVFQKLYPQFPRLEESPNHLLALSYAMENAGYKKPMRLLPLKRISSAFHSTELTSGTIASATAIRQALKENKTVQDYLPNQAATLLSENPVIDWEKFWPFLRYRILSTEATELNLIYQMTEGLEYRLKEAMKQADSVEDFLRRVKTKRYTWTRLQRLLCYLLLNITKEDWLKYNKNNYLHILGYTAKGKNYLQQEKKRTALPLISKFGKQEAEKYPLSLRADTIYQLADSKISEQNFGCYPIFIKNPLENTSHNEI